MKVSIKINIKASQKNLSAYLKLLKKAYPEARIALHYSTPLEMLVATILSAQCTDARVNKVTPALFKKYRSCLDYVKASPQALQQDIHSTGFYKNKTKSIQGACRVLLEKFGGKMPRTLQEMVTLPGVGRKTASVVLFNAYGVIEGVVVDTHVRRLSQRLGLTAQKTPEKIEQDLMKIVPRKEWAKIAYLLIDHGRAVCKAVRPNCGGCVLNKLCPSAFAFDERGRWVGLK